MLVFCWLPIRPGCIILCCIPIAFCWYGIPIMPACTPIIICCCGTPTIPGCIPYMFGCRGIPIMPGCMPIIGPELTVAPAGTPIMPGIAPPIIAVGLAGCIPIMAGVALATLTGCACVIPKKQPHNQLHFTQKLVHKENMHTRTHACTSCNSRFTGKPRLVISSLILIQGVMKQDVFTTGPPCCCPTYRVKALKDVSIPTLPPWCQNRLGISWHRDGCVVCLALRLQGCSTTVTITVFLTWRQHAVTVSQEHYYGSTLYRSDAVPVTESIASKRWRKRMIYTHTTKQWYCAQSGIRHEFTQTISLQSINPLNSTINSR